LPNETERFDSLSEAGGEERPQPPPAEDAPRPLEHHSQGKTAPSPPLGCLPPAPDLPHGPQEHPSIPSPPIPVFNKPVTFPAELSSATIAIHQPATRIPQMGKGNRFSGREQAPKRPTPCPPRVLRRRRRGRTHLSPPRAPRDGGELPAELRLPRIDGQAQYSASDGLGSTAHAAARQRGNHARTSEPRT